MESSSRPAGDSERGWWMPRHLLLFAFFAAFSACVHQAGRALPAGDEFRASADDGSEYTMRIIRTQTDEMDRDSELQLYEIEFLNPVTGVWLNLCMPDRNGLARAIPLSGWWDAGGSYHPDDTRITFACTSGVLGKCVRWGYKPWKIENGVPLQRLHQACVRMTRADYCGNGNGHTKEGTEINIWDVMSIQKREPESGMAFEAAWDENGATYISRTRWHDTGADLMKECPDKLAGHIHEGETAVSPGGIVELNPSTLLFNESFQR